MDKNTKRKIILILPPALIMLLYLVLAAPASAHAAWYTIEPIYKVLKTNTNIKDVWTNVRNMINVVIIAALIFIAFANILRINLNNYAIKKFLPALIAGIILANFSYFICQVCIDLANVAMNLLMNGATGSASGQLSGGNVGVAGAFDFSSHKVDPDFLAREFLYVIFEIVGSIFVFILAVIFFIRNYIIYFLVALSPLAMMATVLPETKSVFKQWSSYFFKWTFMPLISLFWLWLGGMWWSSGFDPNGGGTPPVPGQEFNSTILGLAFAGFCYYMALTSGFKLTGEINNKIGNVAKSGLQRVNNLHGDAQAWAQRNAANHDKDSLKGRLWRGIGGGLAATNYRTYSGGWNARMGARKSAREKALTKSPLYNRIAGPLAQIEGSRDRNLEDFEFASPTQLRDAALTQLDNIRNAYNSNSIKNDVLKRALDSAGVSGMTPGQQREQIMRTVLGMNTQKVQDSFQNAGIAGAKSFDDMGKMVALFRSTNKARRQRGGAVIDPMFASTSVTEEDSGRSNGAQGATGSGSPTNVSPADVHAARSVARGELSAEGAADAASGRQGTDTVNISTRSINEMADAINANKATLTDEANHQVTASTAVAERLAFNANQAGGGDDGIVAARDSVPKLRMASEAGLEALRNSDATNKGEAIKTARQHLNEITDNYNVSLKPHEGDNTRMEQELVRILEATKRAVDDISPNLARELNSFNSDQSGWKSQKLQTELSTVDSHAEIQAVNQHFAGQIPAIAEIGDLKQSLETHLDTLIRSNEGLQEALSSNPSGINMGDLKTELHNTVNTAINQRMAKVDPSVNDQTSRIRESMVKALTDTNVNKTLARTFQKASEGALRSTPQQVRVHDVRPPANPSGSVGI